MTGVTELQELFWTTAKEGAMAKQHGRAVYGRGDGANGRPPLSCDEVPRRLVCRLDNGMAGNLHWPEGDDLLHRVSLGTSSGR